jgi:malonyl-CoA O-methyltransferase
MLLGFAVDDVLGAGMNEAIFQWKGWTTSMSIKNRIQTLMDKRSSLQKAVDWVKNNRIPGSGIVVHHKTKNVTPEVTGYLITSLYNAGEKDLALELARWEMTVQQPDGSFLAPDNIPYTFDTAQVARGFLTVLHDLPEVEPCLRRACDFIVGQIDEYGEVRTPSYDAWRQPGGLMLSKYCNLFVLSPLLEAGQRLGQDRYQQAAVKSLTYYKSQPDIVEFKPNIGTLSHIFGYMLEALADLGERNLVRRGMAQVAAIQKKNGAIPAYPGVEWICSTGMAQLGLAWYKTGEKEKAEYILKYLEHIQRPSGGFWGGYGKGATYFPGQEISWANKFFIDLYLLVKGKHG